MKKVVNRSYSLIFAFLVILSFNHAYAQVTHRNLLPEFNNPELTQAIIPQENFKPFPQTPEGWKKILPDSVIDLIIKKGDDALTKPFEEIPATVMLEFVRNNNRTDYEEISFQKRNRLWNMVMAESVEG